MLFVLLVLIILYPTNAGGIIIVLKMPLNHRILIEYAGNLIELKSPLKSKCLRTVFVKQYHGIIAHIP